MHLEREKRPWIAFPSSAQRLHLRLVLRHRDCCHLTLQHPMGFEVQW
jgi:hypothetical protein